MGCRASVLRELKAHHWFGIQQFRIAFGHLRLCSTARCLSAIRHAKRNDGESRRLASCPRRPPMQRPGASALLRLVSLVLDACLLLRITRAPVSMSSRINLEYIPAAQSCLKASSCCARILREPFLHSPLCCCRQSYTRRTPQLLLHHLSPQHSLELHFSRPTSNFCIVPLTCAPSARFGPPVAQLHHPCASREPNVKELRAPTPHRTPQCRSHPTTPMRYPPSTAKS